MWLLTLVCCWHSLCHTTNPTALSTVKVVMLLLEICKQPRQAISCTKLLVLAIQFLYLGFENMTLLKVELSSCRLSSSFWFSPALSLRYLCAWSMSSARRRRKLSRLRWTPSDWWCCSSNCISRIRFQHDQQASHAGRRQASWLISLLVWIRSC